MHDDLQTSPLKELSRIWELAWPVALGQLAVIGMGVTDLIMVGRLGELELAGMAAGNLWAFLLLISGIGMMMGLDAAFSQAHGAGQPRRAGRALWHAVVIGVVISAPITALHFVASPALRFLAQPEHILPIADRYCRALAWGNAPLVLFYALKQFLQGLGKMRPATWVLFGANLLNIFGNWVFVYGHLGSPAFGAEGAGWCTTLVRSAAPLALLAVAWRDVVPRWDGFALHVEEFRRLVVLGSPVGFHLVLEVGAFTAIGVMMGWIGSTELAANSIAFNLSAIAFMVAMGISAAASTRVGNLIGAGRPWLRPAAIAIGLGALVMACSAVVLMFLAGPIARLYTSDPGVGTVVLILIPYAAAYAIFDGVQVVASGVLRGAGDTRFPAALALSAFWLLGLPIGYVLAFPWGLAERGLWTGLVLALALLAGLLSARIWWVHRRGGLVV